MPGYKGHLVGGTLTFALILYALDRTGVPFSQAQVVQWYMSTLAGCLFPDVDVKSKGQNLFYKGMLCLLLCMLFYEYHRPFIVMSVAAMIPMVVRHRGLFHQLWFIVGVPIAGAFFLATYYPAYASTIYFNTLFFIAGAISHVWLDLGFKRLFFS